MWWALIRKELREIAPFAIVGAVYCLLVVLALHSATRHIPSPLSMFGFTSERSFSSEKEVLVPPYFNESLVFLLGLLTVPLVCGFALRQTLGEEYKRTYPLLIHRPMGRTAIFLCKLFVGIGVYLCLSLSVILILAFDSAVPGRYAFPFEWDMALSPIGLTVGGIALYLSIFLTGLRRERWYGTRWMPALAGICIFMVLVNCTELWRSSRFFVTISGLVACVWIVLAILDQIWKRDY